MQLLQESLEDLGCPKAYATCPDHQPLLFLPLWAVPQRQTEIIAVGRNSKRHKGHEDVENQTH